MKPTFIYIGAARAGSTWLYQCLRRHPEIYVPAAKDIEFFDNNFNKGEQWYFSFFKNAAGKTAVGELSHDYYLHPAAAQRIHDLLPEVRLICCLREPVDKMYSHYKYARRFRGGREALSVFTAMAERAAGEKNNDSQQPGTLDLDWNLGLETVFYAERLAPFFELFPKENILVLFYEDLKKDPAAFIRRVYSFLGVNPDYEPDVLHQRVNPAGRARIPALAHAVYFAARVFRLLGLANLVGTVKHNKLFKSLLYNRKEEISIPPAVRRIETLCPGIEQNAALARLIGKPLPQAWSMKKES